MIPLQLVSGNAELASTLLRDGSATQCAHAVLPSYPLPDASDDVFWQSSTGRVIATCMEKAEMSHDNIRLSPDAFSLRLFPSEWRLTAKRMARRRLLVAADANSLAALLIEQVGEELGCTKSAARLQLAAAKVTEVQARHFDVQAGVTAYITYGTSGIHVHRSHVDITLPDEHALTTLPDELSAEEQLVYLVLTDHLSKMYRRVAYQQPLALGASSDAPLARLLSFCDVCYANWFCDPTGNATAVLACPEATCDYTVHECCAAGRRSCPIHPSQPLTRHTALAGDALSKGCDVVQCVGIMPVHGAWCVQLQSCSRSGSLLLLHPAALESVIAATDACVASGHWYLEQNHGARHNQAPFSRRVLDVISEAAALWHVNWKGVSSVVWSLPGRPCGAFSHCVSVDQSLPLAPPALLYPCATSLGQAPLMSPPALRCGSSRLQMIAELQVYSEPEFGIMCARMRASCSSGDKLDTAIMLWMHHCMPILCGRFDPKSTDADACRMHSWAHSSILSSRTRERAIQRSHEHRHLSVVQTDPVVAPSVTAETELFAKLGLEDVAPPPAIERPGATPDVPTQAGNMVTTIGEDYGSVAISILLWPRSYASVLRDVISDASQQYELSGAMDTILSDEQPWCGVPGVILKEHAVAFRKACIRSPVYGRIYLWLQKHGDKYAGARGPDTTGLIAGHPKLESTSPHKGSWEPVSRLCICTGAAYAAFGCGPMAHWRQVLTHGRKSFLFETNLASLRAIGDLPIHDTELVHVVPCVWQDMSLADLEQSAVVATACSQPPILQEGGEGSMHLLTRQPLQAGQPQSQYLGCRKGWHHHAHKACRADVVEHTFRVYDIMQPRCVRGSTASVRT